MEPNWWHNRFDAHRNAMQSKGWCATIFSPGDTDEELDEYYHGFSLPEGARYAILGKETCPETSRLHLQTFIYFSTKRRRNFVKKALQFDGHCEPIKGTCQQNVAYCTKDGDFQEFGDRSILPEADRRGGNSSGANHSCANQRLAAVTAYKRRRRIADTLADDVNASYQNVKLCELHAKFEAPRVTSADGVHVSWFFGATGLGKSMVADKLTQCQGFRPVNYKWWEGYDADKAVIVDDYRKDFCKFHELLKLIDIYPFRVETKGGSRQCFANTFFITSPCGPKETWSNRTEEDIGQLLRRVHTIVEFLPESQLGSHLLYGQHVHVHKGTLPDEETVRGRMEEENSSE